LIYILVAKSGISQTTVSLMFAIFYDHQLRILNKHEKHIQLYILKPIQEEIYLDNNVLVLTVSGNIVRYFRNITTSLKAVN